MDEVWRQIPSFPLYEASSKGRIRSANRVRQLQLNDDGYYVVDLYVGGTRSKQRVNRLVCEAFHGPCPYPAIMDAAHRNGYKTSNTPRNLRWAFKRENAADSLEHGTRVHGEKHPASLFTAAQISIIRAQYGHKPTGATIARLADAFEVGKLTIRNIVEKKSWVTPAPKKRRRA
jgi:hypothetical protein